MAAPKGNKNAIGNKGGHPPLFSSPEELSKKIEEYFNSGRDTKTIVVGLGTMEIPVYGVCDLAYFLGFESRQSLYDYEDNIEFSYIIKRARLRIESKYEQNLQYNNATGSIFALKNMGWKDKQEVDHSGEIGTYDITEARNKLVKGLAAITNTTAEGETDKQS